MATALKIEDFRKLLAEKPADFRKQGATYCATEKRLVKTQKELAVSIPEWGKHIFVIREDYERQQSLTPIPAAVAGISFAKYARGFYDIADLNNHAESCGNAARFIRASLITEDDYDLVSTDGRYEALERTSRILTKAGDKFDHPAVLEAAKLLKARPSNLLKQLKGILDRFVTQKNGDEELTVFLTEDELKESQGKIAPEKAHEMAATLAKADIGVLIAEIASVAQTTDDVVTAKRIVHGIVNTQKAFAANVSADGKRRFSAEELNGWALELNPPKSRTVEDYKADYQNALATLAEVENAMLQVEVGLTEKWAAEMAVSDEANR